MKELVSVLELVPEGKALLEAARKKSATVEKRITPGDASFTERAMLAAYSARTGKESFAESIRVRINRRHSLADASLDLAHELVHFTERRPVDPYADSFSRSGFVRAGIEGEGGELAAFEAECKVAQALEKAHPAFPRHRYCERFRRPDKSFDKEAARLAYYAEGKASLMSGIGSKPYPVQLASEFDSARKSACATNSWKLNKLRTMAPGGRDPHSASVLEEVKKLRAFHEAHCR